MAVDAPAWRDAYLVRLGLDAEPPSVEALFRLHRAQVERVAYETLWIQLGESWSVDARESVQRIATRQRGGYCFHLNGAFSELLRSLGYDVTRHVGGVHGPDGATEHEMTNHLVLTAHGLPTTSNPGGSWYLDAGLGDALYEPLPLNAGTYEQGPMRFGLESTPGAVGDWHLTHDPSGDFTGMAWRSAAVEMDAFVDRHRWLSTSPDSGFVKVLTVQRRDATGGDILRGLVLTRVGAASTTGAPSSTASSESELIAVLRDPFGLDVDALDADARRALWTNVHRTHLAWQARSS